MSALFERVRSGANWFYWIAALSLVSVAMSAAGGEGRYLIGLGFLQELVVNGSPSSAYPGLALGSILVVVLSVVAFGWLANQGSKWAFMIGMGLYVLDGLMCLVEGDVLGGAFHGLPLFFLFSGFQAVQRLSKDSAETQQLQRLEGPGLGAQKPSRWRAVRATAWVAALLPVVAIPTLYAGYQFSTMREKLEEDSKAVAAGAALGRAGSPHACLTEAATRFRECRKKWSAVECRWIEPNFLESCLVGAGVTDEFCRPIPHLSHNRSLEAPEIDFEEALAWTDGVCSYERVSADSDMCRRVLFVARYQCDVKYPDR